MRRTNAFSVCVFFIGLHLAPLWRSFSSEDYVLMRGHSFFSILFGCKTKCILISNDVYNRKSENFVGVREAFREIVGIYLLKC